MPTLASKPPGSSSKESAFLTPAELCQRWKVSEMFLLRMRRAGRLKVYKIRAAAVRFAMADVLRFEQEAAA